MHQNTLRSSKNSNCAGAENTCNTGKPDKMKKSAAGSKHFRRLNNITARCTLQNSSANAPFRGIV